MTTPRLLAVAAIFVLSALAWLSLGASIVARTGEYDGRLRREVVQLWGGEHVQHAPAVCVERSREVTERVTDTENGRSVLSERTRTVVDCTPVGLSQSRVAVDLALEHRQKGLLWYDTYEVGFDGRYVIRNPDPVARSIIVELAFPSAEALYDRFRFVVNGERTGRADDLSAGMRARVTLGPGASAPVELAYRSRGLGQWTYAFAAEGVTQVEDFRLTMTTDFADVDFPPGTLSPSVKTPSESGWRLAWQFDSLVTGQRVGMDLPERMNPGPLAARITAFAPISLLFFLVVLVIIGVLQDHNLHPMNYAFLSAAFFAFHLLLAYLVDHISIHAAFVIAAVVSILLVVSYLRIVAGTHFAVARAGLAQLVFLVLFSYAFFFEGFTGLTVTVGAIVTLFVLMQVTARLDWAAVFGSSDATTAAHSAVPGADRS